MSTEMVEKGIAPLRLHFTDQTKIVVTPDDEDRFITTAAEAARACRHAQDVLKFKEEFDALLRHANQWCRGHAGTVSSAYLSFSSEGLNLFILTKGSEYRFDFDDAVSDLDIEIAGRFQLCPTDVSHFPEAPVQSLTSFFDPQNAMQLYGN